MQGPGAAGVKYAVSLPHDSLEMLMHSRPAASTGKSPQNSVTMRTITALWMVYVQCKVGRPSSAANGNSVTCMQQLHAVLFN